MSAPPKDNLLRRIGITTGCRFNAHARLKSINNLSNFSISLLSFVVVIISMITLVYGDYIPKTMNVLLSFLSVSASVFIIIITLLEGAKNNSVAADRMHRCGIELLALYNRYQHHLESNATYPPKREFISEYNSVIARYPENHEETDFLKYMLETPHDFSANNQKFRFARGRIAVGMFRSYWLYISMIVVPVSLLIIISISTLGPVINAKDRNESALGAATEHSAATPRVAPHQN